MKPWIAGGAAVGLVAVLAGCGGGADEALVAADGAAQAVTVPTERLQAAAVRAAPAVAAAASPSGPTLAQRRSAAGAVARRDADCAPLTAFYWEIGDAQGVQGSGVGGRRSGAGAPTADTALPVASAAKWVVAAVVLQQSGGPLSLQEVQWLNATSGHANLGACKRKATVQACLDAPGAWGGRNGDLMDGSVGHFHYNGGHLQVLAAQRGAGDLDASGLNALMADVAGGAGMSWDSAQVAGGLRATPRAYGQFLQGVVSGVHGPMRQALGRHAVCTRPDAQTCPTAVYSPVNQREPGGALEVSQEAWHYSLGHWVEDDPEVGDGAYSSPGAMGFYPWIAADRRWWGLLARVETQAAASTAVPAHRASAVCGRKIRAAWLRGG